MQNFHVLIFQLGTLGHCKPSMYVFHYVKKKQEKRVEKNNKDGVQLMVQDSHPIHITGYKWNMWAERERES